MEPGAFTLVWLDRSPHPNAAKVFINWLLSRDGQMAVQRVGGGVNDSLRIDIPKTELRPMARRKEGAKYMVTWKAEWMDAEPMQKVVNQALAKSGASTSELRMADRGWRIAIVDHLSPFVRTCILRAGLGANELLSGSGI